MMGGREEIFLRAARSALSSADMRIANESEIQKKPMNSQIWSAPILFALMSTAVSGQAPIAPQPTSIAGAVTHVYKTAGDTQLRLHVFSPADHRGSSTRPAIVFFFGGGWISGTVEQFVPQSKHLAEEG